MNKILFVIVLLFAATVSAFVDEKCIKAAQFFVDEYNKSGKDSQVKELKETSGCWTVGDDLHLNLIMQTGQEHKTCLNVILKPAQDPTEVASFGTCR